MDVYRCRKSRFERARAHTSARTNVRTFRRRLYTTDRYSLLLIVHCDCAPRKEQQSQWKMRSYTGKPNECCKYTRTHTDRHQQNYYDGIALRTPSNKIVVILSSKSKWNAFGRPLTGYVVRLFDFRTVLSYGRAAGFKLQSANLCVSVRLCCPLHNLR